MLHSKLICIRLHTVQTISTQCTLLKRLCTKPKCWVKIISYLQAFCQPIYSKFITENVKKCPVDSTITRKSVKKYSKWQPKNIFMSWTQWTISTYFHGIFMGHNSCDATETNEDQTKIVCKHRRHNTCVKKFHCVDIKAEININLLYLFRD